MLGAREALIFEEKNVYYLFYDGAGPKGWLACLATSKDLGTWEKNGPILDFGKPGESDFAAAWHWISALGPRIHRVHFKDYRRAVGSVDGFCDLLSGAVNWAGVIKELKAAGYRGWVAAEMIPPVPFYKHCPEVLIHNTSRAMDAIFAL